MAIDAEERELRLALVMTGGVSLAVWMGGVAAEVHRLVCGEGVYDGLRRLTDTRVTVDVISGSSAGGLNGALLGTALYYGLVSEKFDELRNLWFSAGSFSHLLRNPRDENPPSVLLGDDYFTPQIQDVLKRWVDAGVPSAPVDNPLTVVLTAALLSPDFARHTDVFGVTIHEPVHRARFTFGPEHLGDSATLPARLALAARTSASFPGAFEPSFVPVGSVDAIGGRPDMHGIANFSRSRWAVDGGVLMNKPVEPALDLIEAREARGEIRRVLAYVNPDPGGPPDGDADPGGPPLGDVELQADMPSLSSVILSCLLTVPRAESIAGDLTEIADYNRRLAGRHDNRDRLVWGYWTTAAGPDPEPPAVARRNLHRAAQGSYRLWVRRRVARAVRTRIEGHLSRVNRTITDNYNGDSDKFVYTDLLAALEERRLATGWLPSNPPKPSLPSDDQWHYGFTPIEYMVSLLLDLVRRTYALLPAPGPETEDLPGGAQPQLVHDGDEEVRAVREKLGTIRGAIHDERTWLRALRAVDDDYYAYWLDHLDQLEVALCPTDVADAIYDRWPTPPADLTTTPPAAATAITAGSTTLQGATPGSDLRARPDPQRVQRIATWLTVQELLRRRDTGSTPLTGTAATAQALEVAAKLAASREIPPIQPLLGFTTLSKLQGPIREGELRVARRLAAQAQDLAELVEQAVKLYTAVWQDPATATGECAAVRRPWEPLVLRQTVQVLTARTTGKTRTLDEIVFTAADLFFVHSMIDDDVGGPEARIDFAQIAATAPNQLVPDRRDPAVKLAGLQLGHFGGFVKESWRANDWMWGALDGTSRLIPLLLDPIRLRQRFQSAEVAATAVESLATGKHLGGLDDEERAWLAQQWTQHHDAKVREELSFLDPGTDKPLPGQLPATAAAITRLAQLLIAARELPQVRRAIEKSTADGGDECFAASLLVEQAKRFERGDFRIPLQRVPELLDLCQVGSERVADEIGSDAGAAIATQAAAVMATAGAGSRSGLGPLRHGAGAIRVALIAAYYTALSAARRSGIGFALVTLLLAVGAGAVAARLVGGEVPDSVLVVAIAALALWVLLTGFTAGARRWAISSTLLLGAIALSFIPPQDVCSTFATTCDANPDQPGWKGTVQWLLPATLALLAVIFAVVAYRISNRRADERIPIKRSTKVLTWIPAATFAGLAIAYVLWLHDGLFTGDGTANPRAWVINRLEGWSSANILVILIGLPLLFVLLGYIRQTYRDARVDRSRKMARKQIESSGDHR